MPQGQLFPLQKLFRALSMRMKNYEFCAQSAVHELLIFKLFSPKTFLALIELTQLHLGISERSIVKMACINLKITFMLSKELSGFKTENH